MFAAWLFAANALLGPAILLHVEDGAGMTREALVQSLEIRGVAVVDDPFATLVTVNPAVNGPGCRILVRDAKGAAIADQTLQADADLPRTAALMILDVLKTEGMVQARIQYDTLRIEYLPLVKLGTQGGKPLDMPALFRRVGHPEYARSAGRRELLAGALLAGGAVAFVAGDAIFDYDVFFSRHRHLVAGIEFDVGFDLLGLGLALGGAWQALHTNPLPDTLTQSLVDEHNEKLREDLGVPAPLREDLGVPAPLRDPD